MSRNGLLAAVTRRRPGVDARWIYLAVGVATLLLGIAEITVGVIPFALDQTVVPAVGGVALLLAYRVARARWREETVEADTPDPELVAATPTPGEDLRETLKAMPAVRRSRYRPMLRQQLSDVAVGALVRYTNLDESTARERVRDGTWTDDASAAEFLRESAVDSSPLSTVRRYLLGESAYERRIRETIDAIASIPGHGSSPEPSAIDSLWRRVRSLRNEVEGGEARTGRTAVRSGSGDTHSGGDAFDAELTDPRNAATGESRPTRRWRGVGAIALLCVAVGVLYQRPGLVLAGVAAVGFVAAGRPGRVPEPALAVERTVDDDRPDPGEPVEVTVSVRNEGDAAIPDLRLIDGVPAALGVAEGSPRLGTVLRPGEATTFTYSVTARRGVHEFGSPMAICRDLPGTAERVAVPVASTGGSTAASVGESTEETPPAETDPTVIVCRPRFAETTGPVPLRRHTTLGQGQVTTATGGSGVEFHTTREYRPGDPLNRIDWNRRARTGEFATLEFREEHAATVVVVVDARDAAYCSPGTDDHAVDRGVEAAGRMGAGLLADGHRVGLATLGPRDCWLAPGSGRDHASRFRDRLATDDALASVRESAVDSGEWRRRLRQRLPDDAQLLVYTPLVDDGSARLVRKFDARGYPVTTVSPDPTGRETPGQLLATLGRQFRVTDLRRADVPVVDWGWDDSLDATLERYAEVNR